MDFKISSACMSVPARITNASYSSWCRFYKSICVFCYSDGDGGYGCEFVDVPHDDDHCVICLLPARDPQQTKCECAKLYCKSCYDKLKTTSGTCPTCRQPLDAFPDRKSARKVTGLRVKCTFKGCPWINELRLLYDHLGKCGYMLVSCAHGCGDQVIRDSLHFHHTEECLLRRHRCEHCNAEGPYKDMIGGHLDECPDLMIPCPNSECEVSTKRKDMASHHLECPHEIISCPYKDVGCTYTSPRHTMADHKATSCGHHLDLAMVQLKKQDQKITNKDMEYEKDLEKKITQLQMLHEEKVTNLETQLQNLHEKQEKQLKKLDEKQETELKKRNELETQLQKLDDKLETQLTNLDTKITNLETKRSQDENIALLNKKSNPTGSNLTYVFKMSADQSRGGWTNTIWESPKFYYSGYKMHLFVFAMGVGDAVTGTHISVFLHKDKGEHDATLTWPVSWKCTVTLLNQLRDGDHYAITQNVTMTDSSSYLLINHIPNYMLGLKQKEQCQYLKDDNLYLRVQVELLSWLIVSTV